MLDFYIKKYIVICFYIENKKPLIHEVFINIAFNYGD